VATRLFLVAHRGQQGQERAAVRIAQYQPRYRVVGGIPIGRSAYFHKLEEKLARQRKMSVSSEFSVSTSLPTLRRIFDAQ
jgi:hypothetical protein